MRIKTITCHDVYNLGASLQAYALQTYLLSLGHDVEIIDYKPNYLSNHFKLNAVNNPIFDKPLLRQLYLLAKLPGRLISLSRKKAFDDFTDKYLNLTRRFNSYEELKANAPEADVYIAGSDQIWNTLFPNGRDAAFYLDFGNSKVKRISYAASFATSNVVPEFREFVKKELQKIDSISIREKISLPLLHSLGCMNGVAVCDPVFLLSKKEWLDLADNSSRNTLYSKYATEKYILLYLTDRSKPIENIANAIKVATGYKIYAIGALRAKYADKNFTDAGPLDFVWFVNNAQFVISNSFHATAFSLLLGTKFCVVNRVEGINERMRSLLEDFSLSSRLVNSYQKELLEELNSLKINHHINEISDESKVWLKKQLII